MKTTFRNFIIINSLKKKIGFSMEIFLLLQRKKKYVLLYFLNREITNLNNA